MRYHFDSYTLDTQTAQLRGAEGDIALRPMTLALLQCLLENADRVVTIDELLDAVWGRQEVTPGVVSQSVRELRKALSDSAQDSRFIETKHKLGYRFIAALEIQTDASLDAQKSANSALAETRFSANRASITASKPVLRKGGFWAVLGLLLIGISLSGWIAMQAFTDANASDSLRSIEVVHDGRPQEPEALDWYRNGLAALRDGNLIKARELFERSLQREPFSVAAMLALADTLAQAGEMQAARGWLKSASELAAKLPQIEQLRFAAFSAGLEYKRSEALSKLQAVFALNPGDADSGLRLLDAQIAAARMRDAEATLSKLEALPHAQNEEVRIALAQARIASIRGDHQARLVAANKAHAAANSANQQTDALIEQAWAQLFLGEPKTASDTLAKVDQQLAQTPWPAGQVRQLMLQATLQREAGEFKAAIATFEQAAQSARQLGQLSNAAAAEREAAFVLNQSGKHAVALEKLAVLREQHQALGDPRGLGSTLDVSSVAALDAGQMQQAQEFALAALNAYTNAQDRAGEAAVRSNLGMLYARSGRAKDAEQQLQKAIELFRDMGNKRGGAVALSNMAIIFSRDGRASSAREAHEEALNAFRVLGAMADVARLQFNLGIEDRSAGKLLETQTRFREALDGFTQVGAVDYRAQVLASLSELMLLRADPAAAQALLSDIDFDSFAPPRKAVLLTARAKLAATRGDISAARLDFESALELRQQAKMADWALMSELDLAELLAREGHYAQAEQLARKLRRDMLAANDPHAAFSAGILLTGALAAQNKLAAAQNSLDELELELRKRPEALFAFQLDSLRAALQTNQRDQALLSVAKRARKAGYELLALRAEQLASNGVAKTAQNAMTAKGIAITSMPAPFAY